MARTTAGGRPARGLAPLVDLSAMAGLPCSDGRGSVSDVTGEDDLARVTDDSGPSLTELAALLSVLLK